MKLSVGIMTILLAITTSDRVQAQMDSTTLRFAADVLLGTEYGKSEDKVCVKWKEAPTLSTFSDGKYHDAIIEHVVKQLNECLPERMHIKILSHDNPDATLIVHFKPKDEFAEICKQYNAFYIPNNAGYYSVIWNEKYEIQKGVVLIDHARLRGDRLQHFVLEEITQSLGLGGDSARIEDSVFYEDMSIKKIGKTTRLTQIDKQLIRFLYTHVESGMEPIELGYAIGRHWKD